MQVTQNKKNVSWACDSWQCQIIRVKEWVIIKVSLKISEYKRSNSSTKHGQVRKDKQKWQKCIAVASFINMFNFNLSMDK